MNLPKVPQGPEDNINERLTQHNLVPIMDFPQTQLSTVIDQAFVAIEVDGQAMKYDMIENEVEKEQIRLEVAELRSKVAPLPGQDALNLLANRVDSLEGRVNAQDANINNLGVSISELYDKFDILNIAVVDLYRDVQVLTERIRLLEEGKNV